MKPLVRRALGSPRAVIAALCLAAGLLPLGAGATTMFQVDVPTLTQHADTIVRARVVGQESHWTGDRMRIVTDVKLQVEEVLKGAPAATITVRQPGGQVGDIGQRVSGLASFQPGEEVVVFLERAGPVSRVAGMAQGKFHLARGADGALTATPGDTGDAEVIDRLTHAPVTPARTPVAYRALKAQIASALHASPSAR